MSNQNQGTSPDPKHTNIPAAPSTQPSTPVAPQGGQQGTSTDPGKVRHDDAKR